MASVPGIIEEIGLALDYDTFRAKYGEALWSKYRNEQLEVEKNEQQKKALTAERVSPPATDSKFQQLKFNKSSFPADLILVQRTPPIERISFPTNWDSFFSSEQEKTQSTKRTKQTRTQTIKQVPIKRVPHNKTCFDKKNYNCKM
jgi:hypothetical protein